VVSYFLRYFSSTSTEQISPIPPDLSPVSIRLALLFLLFFASAANFGRQFVSSALGIAQRQGAKTWELRAAVDLARLWRDQSRITDAHDLLAPVYTSFTEDFDLPDLIEAKALLDELDAAASGLALA
jgi:hypothetical protein